MWRALLVLLIMAGSAAAAPPTNVEVIPGTPFTALDDVAMMSIPTGVKFKLWFGVPSDDPLKPEWAQLRRVRREGGVTELAYVHKPAWIPYAGNPTLFAIEDAIPRVGHFHYEVRLCTTAGPENCSTWSSSLDPKIGRVGDSPRAWWIYGYLAPSGVPSL